MAKLLIQLAKKKSIDGKERTVQEHKEYLVSDVSKDFNTHAGFVPKAELAKPDGSVVTTNSGAEFVLLSASFADAFSHIKKLPQTVMPKDIGMIIAMTGIGPESVVVDAGTGSGALAAGLARVCKQVHTFEKRDDFIENIKDNIRRLGLTNITLHQGDIIDTIGGVKELKVGADLVTLDLPDPERVIPAVTPSLKIGGYLACYVPTVPQMMSAVETLRHDGRYLVLLCTELIKRDWIVEGQRVRPDNEMLGHTAFLIFARRIQ
jgi:tRNA (adenine57-N1/adenine58-N1)-methyltransferase